MISALRGCSSLVRTLLTIPTAAANAAERSSTTETSIHRGQRIKRIPRTQRLPIQQSVPLCAAGRTEYRRTITPLESDPRPGRPVPNRCRARPSPAATSPANSRTQAEPLTEVGGVGQTRQHHVEPAQRWDRAGQRWDRAGQRWDSGRTAVPWGLPLPLQGRAERAGPRPAADIGKRRDPMR